MWATPVEVKGWCVRAHVCVTVGRSWLRAYFINFGYLFDVFFCLSLPLYSVVIPVSQCLERTRLLLTLAIGLRRHHMWSLAGFPSQSNVYNKILEMRKSGLHPSAWHTHAVSLWLIRASQSYPRCPARPKTLKKLLCTFYTAPCHLWSLWDCTHSHVYSKPLTLGG